MGSASLKLKEMNYLLAANELLTCSSEGIQKGPVDSLGGALTKRLEKDGAGLGTVCHFCVPY